MACGICDDSIRQALGRLRTTRGGLNRDAKVLLGRKCLYIYIYRPFNILGSNSSVLT